MFFIRFLNTPHSPSRKFGDNMEQDNYERLSRRRFFLTAGGSVLGTLSAAYGIEQAFFPEKSGSGIARGQKPGDAVYVNGTIEKIADDVAIGGKGAEVHLVDKPKHRQMLVRSGDEVYHVGTTVHLRWGNLKENDEVELYGAVRENSGELEKEVRKLFGLSENEGVKYLTWVDLVAK